MLPFVLAFSVIHWSCVTLPWLTLLWCWLQELSLPVWQLEQAAQLRGEAGVHGFVYSPAWQTPHCPNCSFLFSFSLPLPFLCLSPSCRGARADQAWRHSASLPRATKCCLTQCGGGGQPQPLPAAQAVLQDPQLCKWPGLSSLKPCVCPGWLQCRVWRGQHTLPEVTLCCDGHLLELRLGVSVHQSGLPEKGPTLLTGRARSLHPPYFSGPPQLPHVSVALSQESALLKLL